MTTSDATAATTLHAEHGVPVALNAGDLLIGEGYRLLAELRRAGRRLRGAGAHRRRAAIASCASARARSWLDAASGAADRR